MEAAAPDAGVPKRLQTRHKAEVRSCPIDGGRGHVRQPAPGADLGTAMGTGLRAERIQEEKEEMSKFDEIIEGVLKHEGGYVNDPTDLGGETNFGITKRFYPDVDIKNLTEEGAKEIYKRDYWDKNKVDDVPDDLKHIFFDMCVNQGRGTAVKVLQRAINGKGGKIAVDGGFGPGTKGALAKYKPSVERVRCYRLKHYYDLVNKKPEQEKFLFGWYRRALEV